MKRMGIILSDGFEEMEAITTIDILRRAGIKIEILGLKNSTITGAHGIPLLVDDVFDYYSALDFDSIIFAGGMKNAINLSEDENVLMLIKHYDENKKLIAGICASPALVLSKAGVLENKNVTCYPSEELISNLKNSNYIDKCVVVCDNIITSQSPYTAMAFALAIVKYLGYDIDVLQKELKGN